MENNNQKILMKNNIMVKAKYDLNVIQNKIFQLILFEFQKNKENVIKDLEEGSFKLNIDKKDMKNLLKKKVNSTTKGISDILIKLRKADIFFYDKNKRAWGNYGFINGFTYYEDKDVFEIEVSNKIYNLLMNYLKGYTPVNMAIFFSFKTFYSQRFYELLRLWSNSKHIINYSLEELKELLMLKDKYPLYKDFKKRIVNPVLKELNEKSMMQIEIKEHKVNRKVVSIDFIVKDNDKRKYFQDKENEPLQQQQQKTYSNNKGKELKFMNFDQREYDYNSLEKKLLGWDED